jgi:phosphate transport system substrate-binding protein
MTRHCVHNDERKTKVMIRRISGAAAVVAAAIGMGACGGSGGSSSDSNTLIGAGSTLIAPLMSTWQPTYNKATNVTVTYGAIGSGGGIDAITGRTVDFGASDAPLTSDQASACKGCTQIPWALAATVVAYHVQGVPNKLHLTGPVLADIYMGKITSWDNSAIQNLNPGVKLPPTKIHPIYRSDGSGDTYAFTQYLSKVSPTWKSKIGFSTEVHFPTGLGGEHNSGVGGLLSQTDGGIAYIAIAYVVQNKFDYALVQNAAGNYPVPGVPSISAAAATVKSVPADNALSIVDPPASASGAYPISTFTYVIVPNNSPKAKTLKPFIDWAISSTAQSAGPKLDFAPLPSVVVAADKKAVNGIT